MSLRTAHTSHYVAERAVPSVVDMTQTQSTIPDTCTSHRGNDRTLAVITTGAAGLAYLAWRAGGVDMTVKSGGGGTFEVGLVSVLVTTAVVSVAGLWLLGFLERRDPRGQQAWSALACFVLAVSLLGPLGATSLSAGLALVSLHLVVGTALVVGARRMRRHGVA
jgi:hypothetical protein